MNVATARIERATSAYRAGLTLLLAAACYEAVARSGAFPAALLPTLPKVASTLWALILDGTMLEHAAYTMYRVLFGLALAVAVALPLGILMGRFRPVENFFLPLASALMPIPSLAWVPVFILWFGLGNTVAILIVFYAALFPMLLNAWSGVRAVNPLWLRAAGAMGADERALFWKVIIPGASPAAPSVPAGVDRGRGRRDARRLRLGPGLGHFRRQGVLERGRDAGRARRDRRHRLRVRAAHIRLDRARHRHALGHGAHGEGVGQL